MFDTCIQCGEEDAAKRIEDGNPAHAICRACGHRHPFLRLPLYCLTGPSGAGKSTVCHRLVHETQDVVLLESDILWSSAFDSPETDYQEYRNLWLRLCKNIGQAGKPVLLCGSVSPGQFESCVEARYFSAIRYLALVCEVDTLASRLRARPAWRQCGSEDFIHTHQDWTRWFCDTPHKHDVTLLDNTALTVEQTIQHVLGWMDTRTDRNGRSNQGPQTEV